MHHNNFNRMRCFDIYVNGQLDVFMTSHSLICFFPLQFVSIKFCLYVRGTLPVSFKHMVNLILYVCISSLNVVEKSHCVVAQQLFTKSNRRTSCEKNNNWVWMPSHVNVLRIMNRTRINKPVGWPMVESLDNRKEKIYRTGNSHTSMECLLG